MNKPFETALLETKLNRPPSMADLVVRPRLFRKLESGLSARLALVSAPAGFGKSTLVSSWLATKPALPSVWYSMDARDEVLGTFLTCLVHAVQFHTAVALDQTLGLLLASDAPPFDAVLATLLVELASLADELVIVLDDFHAIRSLDVTRCVERLVTNAPSRIHWMIITRQDPMLPLARMRAQQQLVEVRVNDLRFRREETAEFFHKCLGSALSPASIGLLDQRAEGWIAGLRLAALSLLEADEPEARVSAVAGEQQFAMDFLFEQVLRQQEPEVHQFLLRTSVLERMSAPLCEAVLGNLHATHPPSSLQSHTEIGAGGRLGAYAILQHLKAANLFIVPLDQEGEWYRYHHLFRELLQFRLRAEVDASAILVMVQRAASWLEQRGYYEEALYAWLDAGDSDSAANLVERQLHPLLDREAHQMLSQWLDRLPVDVVMRRPTLVVAHAWLESVRGRLSAIPPLLRRVTSLLAQTTPQDNATTIRIRGDLETLWAQHCLYLGEIDRALLHSEEAIATLPEDDTFVRGLALTIHATALNLAGYHHRGIALLMAQLDVEPSHSDGRISALIGLGALHLLAGELTEAIESVRLGLALVASRQRPYTVAWAHSLLGRGLLYRNDLEGALAHFTLAVERGYASGKIFHDSLHGLAISLQRLGRTEEAIAAAQRARVFASAGLRAEDVRESQSVLVHLGVLRDDFQRSSGLATAGKMIEAFPWCESPALTWVRGVIATAEDSAYDTAEEYLRQMTAMGAQHQFVLRAVDAWVHWAVLAEKRRDRRTALLRMETAITQAEPRGIIGSFAEGAGCAAELLRLTPASVGSVEFRQQILDAAQQNRQFQPIRRTVVITQGDALYESLTDREEQILRMLVQRLADKEIAQQLVISPLTARRHISNIFEKLQVNNRRQAIARAVDLGIVLPSKGSHPGL